MKNETSSKILELKTSFLLSEIVMDSRRTARNFLRKTKKLVNTIVIRNSRAQSELKNSIIRRIAENIYLKVQKMARRIVNSQILLFSLNQLLVKNAEKQN